MKVRAYLAEEQDRLVPKDDSARHIDFDTSIADVKQIKKICTLFFAEEIKYLGEFESKSDLHSHLFGNDIITHKIFWNSSGTYVVWMPENHRFVYDAQTLIERELKMATELEENIKRNTKGSFDYLFKIFEK